MNTDESLRQLLIDFFGLPADTKPEQLSQKSVKQWDSFAMMQLITELQGAFAVEFDLDEVDKLTSYEEIRAALARKAVKL